MAHAMATMEKPEPEPKQRMAEIRIRMMKGGHMVSHHADEYGPPMRQHVFSKSQGAEMMAHVAKHAKVKMEKESPAEDMSEEGEE